jgi:hypothetical protein
MSLAFLTKNDLHKLQIKWSFLFTRKKTNMSINYATYNHYTKIIQSANTLTDNNNSGITTLCLIPMENGNLYEAARSRLASGAVL